MIDDVKTTRQTTRSGYRIVYPHIPVLSFVLLLAGCYATTNISNEETNSNYSSEALARGGDLYASYCLDCHGVNLDGQGPKSQYIENPPADLTQKSIHFSTTGIQGIVDYPHYSHETIRDRIKHGNETMPALDVILTRSQIDDLTNYIAHEIRKVE